jgi:hypothetical protein
MTKTSISDDQVEQRLRSTLRAVADTMTAPDRVPGASVVPGTQHAPRRRTHPRVGLAVGVTATALALAAAAYVRSGPEYVDDIPRDSIIVEGSVDGSEYLLVETRRNACGRPAKGVELVEERENILGGEWNTIGEEYGERIDECRVDTTGYLANPALFNDSGTEVGDSLVWLWAVHPDVTTVRITTPDSTTDLPVYPVDGAGYALYEVPDDVNTYTAELVINGEVVAGSAEVHDLH